MTRRRSVNRRRLTVSPTGGTAMRLTKLLTASVCGLAAAAVVAGPALADPATGVTPAAIDLVSVGSDTTQVVSNQISADFNATAPASKYYSWNATNPSTGVAGETITTKTGA